NRIGGHAVSSWLAERALCFARHCIIYRELGPANASVRRAPSVVTLPSVSGSVPEVLLPQEPAAKHEPSPGREQNPAEGKERPHAHPSVLEAIIIRASPARTRVGRFGLSRIGLARVRISGIRVRVSGIRVRLLCREIEPDHERV